MEEHNDAHSNSHTFPKRREQYRHMKKKENRQEEG